jgi:hypothetical protein
LAVTVAAGSMAARSVVAEEALREEPPPTGRGPKAEGRDAGHAPGGDGAPAEIPRARSKVNGAKRVT